ncbi:MAG: hypothetical protein LBI82_08840 [Dysgonamonadaceae bacterium]|jgi:hypothetical protein|nr:hypothetical protein [Dysgonamonadaceae bacterium]
MKTSKFFGLFSLLFGLLLFSACDELSGTLNITDIKIEIPKITIPELPTPSALRSAGDYTRFESESVTVQITDGMFAELQQYLGSLNGVTVQSVKLRAETTNNATGNVRGLKITSNALGESFEIASYDIGKEYSDPKLLAYVQKAFNKLITKVPVDFAISGETNVDPGTEMIYTIIINSAFEVSAKIK